MQLRATYVYSDRRIWKIWYERLEYTRCLQNLSNDLFFVEIKIKIIVAVSFVVEEHVHFVLLCPAFSCGEQLLFMPIEDFVHPGLNTRSLDVKLLAHTLSRETSLVDLSIPQTRPLKTPRWKVY
jgi:hypothetical protein